MFFKCILDIQNQVLIGPHVFVSLVFLTFAVFPITFVSWFADAFVWLEGVLTDGIYTAVVQGLGALVHICWEKRKSRGLEELGHALFWEIPTHVFAPGRYIETFKRKLDDPACKNSNVTTKLIVQFHQNHVKRWRDSNPASPNQTWAQNRAVPSWDVILRTSASHIPVTSGIKAKPNISRTGILHQRSGISCSWVGATHRFD